MAVYLIGFAVSVLLIALSEKKHWKVFFLCSLVALLIPCLIAGLRSERVGTDVRVYIKPMFQVAFESNSIQEYFNGSWFAEYRDVPISRFEYGFSLLIFVVTKLTGKMEAVLFAIAACVILPVFLALAKNRKNIPVWLGMLVFYLLFYNATLNMMRQWIAMGLMLLAFQFLLEKKYWVTLILSAATLLFHYSAVIVLLIYVVYALLRLCNRYTLREGKLEMTGGMLAGILVSVIALLAILNLDIVLKLMSSVGFDRFSNYLEGEPMRLLANQIILRLPLFLLFIINWKDFRHFTSAAAFYFVMLLLDMIAAQLISIDTYAFRIGQYFLLYVIIGIPQLYAAIKKPHMRVLTAIAVILYLLVYWYYNFVLQLRHQTYPYQFSFMSGTAFFPFTIF